MQPDQVQLLTKAWSPSCYCSRGESGTSQNGKRANQEGSEAQGNLTFNIAGRLSASNPYNATHNENPPTAKCLFEKSTNCRVLDLKTPNYSVNRCSCRCSSWWIFRKKKNTSQLVDFPEKHFAVGGLLLGEVKCMFTFHDQVQNEILKGKINPGWDTIDRTFLQSKWLSNVEWGKLRR